MIWLETITLSFLSHELPQSKGGPEGAGEQSKDKPTPEYFNSNPIALKTPNKYKKGQISQKTGRRFPKKK